MKPKISIVVPVYNVEKYLNRCLESIVNQTYQNLEIILVDDGSTDNSPQMCDEWAQKDSRICVIHKENAGAGMARNAGLETANGAYICFVDSDDYVDLSMISSIYEEARKTAADMVLFGHYKVNNRGEITQQKVPKFGGSIFNGEIIRDEFLPIAIRTGQLMSLCSALFSTETIKCSGWKVPSEREVYSEDTCAMIDFCRYAKKISVLGKSFYYYCNNGASLSNSARVAEHDKITDFYSSLMCLCKEHGYSEEVEKSCAYPYIGFIIGTLKYQVRHESNIYCAIAKIEMILEDMTVQKVLRQITKDPHPIKRGILFWAMQKKCYKMCYLLICLQNLLDRAG